MTTLKFDTEGITSCPMNETATIEKCMICKYHKAYITLNKYSPAETNLGYGRAFCIYEDVFPELKDFAGLEDCIYIKGV